MPPSPNKIMHFKKLNLHFFILIELKYSNLMVNINQFNCSGFRYDIVYMHLNVRFLCDPFFQITMAPSAGA